MFAAPVAMSSFSGHLQNTVYLIFIKYFRTRLNRMAVCLMFLFLPGNFIEAHAKSLKTKYFRKYFN